jgi:ankyrin repeat protein
MKAAENGHKDIVRMLLDAGADPSPADRVSSCVCVCVYVCALYYI